VARFANNVTKSASCLEYPPGIYIANETDDSSDFVIVGNIAIGKNMTDLCVTANPCAYLLQDPNAVQTFVSNTYIGVYCNGQNHDYGLNATTPPYLLTFAVPRVTTSAAQPVTVSPYFITYLVQDKVYASSECMTYPNTSRLSSGSDFILLGGVAVKRDQPGMCVSANACDIVLQASGSIQSYEPGSYIGITCNNQNYDLLFSNAKMSIIVPRTICSGTSLPGVYPSVPGWDTLTLDPGSGMLMSGAYTHNTSGDPSVLVTGVRTGVELVTYAWKVVACTQCYFFILYFCIKYPSGKKATPLDVECWHVADGSIVLKMIST
jgi:hypothetical protein